MKHYIGRLVKISQRYGQFHRYIGNITAADYELDRYQVKFVKVQLMNNVEIGREYFFQWFEGKHLKDAGISWQTMKLDEMTKALYAGTVIQIRKDLKKIPGKKLLRLSAGLCHYLESFERGFFRIKNTEIICDFKSYKDLDYKIEVEE